MYHTSTSQGWRLSCMAAGALIRRAVMFCSSRSTFFNVIAALTAATVFSLTVACGSSATTSVAAPSPAASGRCETAASSSPASFDSAGGVGTVSIIVERDCTWSASSQASWISLTTSASGQGEGRVTYRVAANADPVSRSGAIGVGDSKVSISQAAAPCRYDVSPTTGAIPSTGGDLALSVHAHTACAWTASSEVTWATVAPDSGHGDATVHVVVSANAGAARAASLVVAAAAVSVTQAAAAAPAPTPAPTPTPTPTPTPAPTPAPTPTPSPTPEPSPAPTPPPPAPKPIKLSGKAGVVSGTCPSITFELKDHTVYTTPATSFDRTSCDRIDQGTDVEVTGVVMPDNRVQANEVKRK